MHKQQKTSGTSQNGAARKSSHQGSSQGKRISQEWTQKFVSKPEPISQGLSRTSSSHNLNGQHPTRCELPSAVHIAQLSSSDDEYLDFNEADDFEMEEEPNECAAGVMRTQQQKSFIGNMNRPPAKQIDKIKLKGFPKSSAQQQMASPLMSSNVSPKYSDKIKEISFAQGLTLQKIQAPQTQQNKNMSCPTDASRVTKTKMTKQQLQQMKDQFQSNQIGANGGKVSFSLRNIVPANNAHGLSVLEPPSKIIKEESKNIGLKRKVIKVLNIGEAINKRDLIRIRSGSPGLRAGQQKDQLANGQTFQGEMRRHGMAKDLQEIQRFNFVLLSRSTEQLNEEQKLGQHVPPQQFQTLQQPTEEAFQATSKIFQLPYQRRMRSASPPALQICTENYIVYS